MAKQLPRSINLLEPSIEPASTWDRIYDWVFKIGRYLIVLVEAVVVLAFVSRFVLDRKNNDLKESLDAKVVLLDQQEGFEKKVANIQLLLNNIYAMDDKQLESSDRLRRVLRNIPSRVQMQSLSMDRSTVKLVCSAPDFATVNEMENNFRNNVAFGDVEVTLTKSGTGTSSVEFTFTIRFTDAMQEVVTTE